MRDIHLYYGDRQYGPDFIVETTTGKWICETKKASDMNDPEVLAKAKAATLWCHRATTATNGPWGYLLIPHDQVRMSISFAGFIAGCPALESSANTLDSEYAVVGAHRS